MRFSVWPNPTQSFAEVLEIARHAESTGWDGLWYADHFMPDGDDTTAPWPEAWTTLAALAASVPRIRLGTLVTGNTYRHPAVLAKMAATVDHISQGRVVLGLGAGWQENEHRQYGVPFYTIGERLERLDEACQVIKGLYREKSLSFDGKFYQLDQASLEPKPVGRLPLLIGGGGEKVTLRITARWADEWNVWGDVEKLRQKMKILDRHCENEGRDPAAIQRSAVALLFLSDDAAFVENMRSRDIGRPTIVGNADEVREIVQAYRDAGVDELIVPDFTLGPMAQKLATLDQFMEKVAGPLR
jgi:F420-dependent oxidoreductase-like protein